MFYLCYHCLLSLLAFDHRFVYLSFTVEKQQQCSDSEWGRSYFLFSNISPFQFFDEMKSLRQEGAFWHIIISDCYNRILSFVAMLNLIRSSFRLPSVLVAGPSERGFCAKWDSHHFFFNTYYFPISWTIFTHSEGAFAQITSCFCNCIASKYRRWLCMDLIYWLDFALKCD